MALIDVLLSSTLGQARTPERLDVALFNGAAEVRDGGYSRAKVARGEWSLQNGSAETVVRFGPFATQTTFDRAVLYRDREVLEEAPLAAPMTIAPQTVYEHTFGVVFLAAQP